MESLISSPPPSPHPSTPWLEAFFLGDNGLLTVELGVLIAMILVFCLFVLGSRRRYTHDTWQGVCILILYTLTTIGIPYLIVLMHRYLGLIMFSAWAYFLIFLYGGSADTMTACNLSGNERLWSTYFRILPLILWTVYLIHAAGAAAQISQFHYIFAILINLIVWNATDTLGAFYYASKSFGLPAITAITDRYLRNKFSNYDESDDPVLSLLTTRGYSFLVEVDNIVAPKKIISTLQVWQCEGELLNPSTGNDCEDSSHKRSGWLKDMCLSYALFNILLTRFGGYCLPESSRHNLRSFVKEGFSNGGQIQDRAFGMIEVELEFLFDFFYTKFYYLSRMCFAYQFNRLWAIALCIWVFALELSPEKIQGQHSNTQFHGHSLEVGITRIVVLLIAVLEAVQLCMRIFSNWIIVKLICLYVQQPRTKKGFCFEKVIIFISNIKIYLLAGTEGRHLGMLKPWKRKLGQYSLLESYDHVPILKRVFRRFASNVRVGQKESPAVTLSMQVKRAVLSSFVVADYGSALSRGTTSLARNGMGELSDLFDEQDTTDAHFILAWHIATSVCEHFSSTEPARVRSRRGDENFRIATQLSKYCAYLVVYAPELVSVHPSTALAAFESFAEHARDTFKGTKNVEERCIKLLELGTDNIEDGSDIFGRVAVLAIHLRSLVLKKPNRGWRVMAEFWAELLLYLAPTENVTPHAERLAKGGCISSHMGSSIFSPFESWLRAFYNRVTRDHGLFLIECGVLITIVFVFCLFVLGCRRRYVHDTWQGACILLLSTLINIGIPYLIGIMRTYPESASRELFPIWSNFLIFVYGSFDTMTAISFSDNQKSVWTFLSFLPLIMGTHYLTERALIRLGHGVYEYFLILYVLSIFNALDTVKAYACASKSEMLPKITAPTVRFMRSKYKTCDEAEADEDPVLTTSGYSYLVEANDAPEKMVTTMQVWECEGPLLNPDNKNSHRLKDMCLSYALFNILLTRFAGYSFPESSRHDLRSFVKERFSEGGQIQDGAFSIIEMELEFLFDLFYTKFYVLTRWCPPKLKRIFGIYVSLAFFVLEFGPYKLSRRANAVPVSSTQLLGYSLEVMVTRVAILVIGVLEVVQLCQRIFSNWTIVNLICRYVRDYESSRTKKIARIERAAFCISNVRFCISGIFKPWKRMLGQYSLLESYNHRAPKRICFPYPVFKPRDGKKESPAVTLSVQVKQAILGALSVSDYGLSLSRGKNSLARNGVGWMADLFDEQDTSDAHFILVWHIATSVCEHPSAQVRAPRGDEHFRVATELSKYCAYLLVFAPELVSAFPSTALATLDRFIEQARDTFKRTRSMKMRCIKLLELGTNDIEDSDDLLGRAALLANHMRNHVLNEPDRGWRVMAEFWTELLLYLAPTENVTAHAEWLPKGGEFITHLWALLTHAGITSRDCFQSTI